ncbi:hypothetical protein [Labrenzia sp. VG12]|uniref:hypothetical protein n=1 Tax=Labrenzia sp. VG12 TaxID=2021862 RepID=UPI0018DF82D0|nr:hypothetical protein [Labrenzia sp. VG12]
MSEHVYQAIWSEDDHRFSVSARQDDGNFADPGADILLDEQVKARGSRQIDLATNPLFHRVNFEKLEESSLYRSFIALLDNYAVHFRDPELLSPAEVSEIETFLDLVLARRSMQIAYEYIASDLVPNLPPDQFRRDLEQIWFQVYTNFYRGKSTHYCTGFEHVFVGEGKYTKNANGVTEKGKISGYHSWVKFALDEVNGRVDYLGYKYDLGGPGPGNPHVVTLQMLWNHMDMRGRLVAELFKKKGGFFVGCSPACEMALATLAYYEGHLGLLTNQKKRVKFGDGVYDLVMYHATTQDGGLGKHVRSFFPIYLGDGSQGAGGSGDVVVKPRPARLQNCGDLRIRAALPNPPGEDQGTEWVEIWNASGSDIVLQGFELRDKMSRPQPIAEKELKAGQILRVAVTRQTADHMQLSNRRGLISLHDAAGEMLAAVSYGRATENQVLVFAEPGAAGAD